MNEIRNFIFQGSPIRVFKDENGEPWFVAKEIAAILGYSETAVMNRRLDDDEKTNLQIPQVGSNYTTNITIINESGLYNAVLGSTKPEAKALRKWVTSEVLPSIRRTGGYIAATGTETPEELYARALTSLKAALDRQKAIVAEQAGQLELQAPDVEYTRNVLASDGLHTVNAVAVHLGISAIRLNKFLVAENWIYRQGGVYYPATRIREKGYCDFHVVPYLNSNGDRMTREHLKWTESGRRAIIELWNKRHPAA